LYFNSRRWKKLRKDTTPSGRDIAPKTLGQKGRRVGKKLTLEAQLRRISGGKRTGGGVDEKSEEQKICVRGEQKPQNKEKGKHVKICLPTHYGVKPGTESARRGC